MRTAERYQRVLAYFEAAMPEPRTELAYDTPFHLLVAVVLSAQCTDKRVNAVTPALFAAYPDAAAMAAATEDEVLAYVHSVSYPNSKSRHLVGMARALVDRFGGEVPASREALTSLPGVGRKTANVIMSVVFEQAALAVDTHVFRVSNRIGLTRSCRTPLQTEQQLMAHIPEDKVAKAHHWLILHGRYTCTARKPRCADCGIAECCRHHATQLRKSQPRS